MQWQLSDERWAQVLDYAKRHGLDPSEALDEMVSIGLSLKENKHIGSSLNQFLEEEGILAPDGELLHDDLAQIRHTLDSRYDDIKSGKVKLIPGGEVVAELRAKSAALRNAKVPVSPPEE